VEDLATCLTWSLDNQEVVNRTLEIGGPEYLAFVQITELILETINKKRRKVNIRPPYLRSISVFIESIFPNPPVSVYWLDYLASNRTCPLDTLPRVFNLLPSRFSHRIEYLREDIKRETTWRNMLTRIE
jgi:NADH dehydrogenase